MLLYCVLNVLLAAGLLADNEKHPSQSPPSREAINTFLENRCSLKNASEALTSFKHYDLIKCFEETARTATPLGSINPEIGTIACKQHMDVIVTCYQRWSKLLQPCLYSEEDYLPEFIIDFYQVVIGEQCAEDPGNSVCGDLPIADTILICVNELEVPKHLEEFDYVIRKEVVCDDIRKGKACVLKNLNKQCPENTDYIKTITGKAEKLLALCSDINEVDS